MVGEEAVAYLREVGEGTRLVVRYRLEEGATDALGYLVVRSATEIVVATAKGMVTIALADVVATKEIPPPPAPRNRR